jgi:UDP:flavonoid glycosyltransferase YjiC (YdhE family)
LFENQLAADATLALYSKALGAVHPDFPRNTTICGFTGYDGPRSGPPKISPELTAFLAKGPAPVVFTLGSFAADDPGDFFETSAAAARRLGLRAVLLVGEGGRDEVSQDVIACRYVPHSWIFPRAAAIVHHAGVGTIGEALVSGRPQLAVPITLDHPDNAAHMRRLGVGRVLPRPRYDLERATRELKLLLGRPGYAAKAAEVSAVVRAENGAETAADVIEAVLERRESAAVGRERASAAA